MSVQIFKNKVPLSYLTQFLDKVCVVKTNKYYLINDTSYKKGVFLDIVDEFCKDIEPFYHISKRKYVTRKLNYNKFITIIRQICKHHQLPISSQIKYCSNYSIECLIYYNECSLE